MIDKKAEQKERDQATMRTLCVIMSPNVRLQGISNSALRQGFLTLSLLTWSLVSTFRMSPDQQHMVTVQ